MRIFVSLIVIVILISMPASANGCSIDERLKEYTLLFRGLDKLESYVPALKPENKNFYEEVRQNFPKQPDKYIRYLTDTDYLIYVMSKTLEEHKKWVFIAQTGAQGIKRGDPKGLHLEASGAFGLLGESLRDVSLQQPFFYPDSQVLVQRGELSEKYFDDALMVVLRYSALADCLKFEFDRIAFE